MSGLRAAKELRRKNTGRQSDPICLEDDDAVLARVLYESEVEAGVGATEKKREEGVSSGVLGKGGGAGGRSGSDAAGRRGVGRKQERQSSEEIVVDRHSPILHDHQNHIPLFTDLCAHHLT